jgi:hypothetical protein
MQKEGSASPPGGMEESGFIEPLSDEDLLTDEDLAEQGDATSDYEPSEAESTFGSLTESVTEHVWEYGRCVAVT